MSVADLTGTTWLINSSYSDPSSTIWKSINFTSNSTAFNAITIYDDMDNEQTIAYRGAEEYPTIVYSRGWTNEAYRTIVITGGTDATDATLIAWLEANAEQETPSVPDVVISYNNIGIATMSESGTKTLETEGTFCTDDITVVYTKPSAPTPTLQAKTNIAPTTSSQTITADAGYDGLSSVQINAISPIRSASNVTFSGSNVVVANGYYSNQITKGLPTGTAGTPTATKGTVSNHAVSVTPSVTNTTGYITGSTKTGTAVSVSASELVSGTKSITENGTGIDVTNYASVDVNVSGGGGGQLYIFSDSTYLHEEAYLGNQAMSSRAAFTDPNLAAGVTVMFYTWGDYILDTIEGVTSGNTYPFTTVTRGTYTFTMPNESVDCLLAYDD